MKCDPIARCLPLESILYLTDFLSRPHCRDTRYIGPMVAWLDNGNDWWFRSCPLRWGGHAPGRSRPGVTSICNDWMQSIVSVNMSHSLLCVQLLCRPCSPAP